MPDPHRLAGYARVSRQSMFSKPDSRRIDASAAAAAGRPGGVAIWSRPPVRGAQSVGRRLSRIAVLKRGRDWKSAMRPQRARVAASYTTAAPTSAERS